MIDYNTQQLDKHLLQLDEEDARQEQIEQRTQEISSLIRAQHVVKINGCDHLYHVEDFMGDMNISDETNTGDFCTILSTDADAFEVGMHDKFELWCEMLATADIDDNKGEL